MLVGARLDAGAEHGAGGVAELGAVVGGVDLELRQRVRWRLDVVAGAVHEVVDVHVVVHAVQDEVVLGGALAVGREVSRAAAAGKGVAPQRRSHAGRQLRDIDPVASVERGVVNGVSVHDLTHGCMSHVCSRGGAAVTVTVSVTAPGFKTMLILQAVLNIEGDIFLGRRLKLGSSGAHLVMADFDRRKDVFALGIRLVLQHEIRVRIGECHQGARYDCARGIFHNTGDSALVNLGQRHACKDKAEAQNEQESPKHVTFRLPQLNGSHFLNSSSFCGSSPHPTTHRIGSPICPFSLVGRSGETIAHIADLTQLKKKNKLLIPPAICKMLIIIDLYI